MANEAKLNLVISAKDEAQSVIEQFAQKMEETFRTIKESMNQLFSPEMFGDGFKNPIDPAVVGQIQSDVLEINRALEDLANQTDFQTNTIDKAWQNTVDAISSAAEKVATEVRSLGTTMDEMNQKMETAATKNKEASDKIKESLNFGEALIGGSILQGYGQQVDNFFKTAISGAVDFDQNIVNTAASLNSNLPEGIKLSADQVQQLNDRALQLGQTGFFSANQIADAMNVMARQGINFQQIMQGGIDTVSTVAAANQADLGDTANVMSDIIHEMGDELKTEFGGDLKTQLGGIGDAMTAAMHHARISMDDFLNTMKYVGPQASAVGESVGDLSAQIALLGEHGIRGSQAGTTLRRELTNLIPQSKEAAAMMKQLGMITADGSNIFFDASGKMKPMAEVQELLHEKLGKLNPEMQEMAIKTIFGQYALSGMTAIVNTTPEAFQELTDAMHKQGVASEIVAEKSKGWGIQVQALRAHFETLMKQIGEQLKPVIETLMGVLNNLMNAWERIPASTRQAIVIFGAVTGVVLTVAGTLLAFIGTIGMLRNSIIAFIPALEGLSVPFLPLVAIIGAVALAVIGLKTAWEHNLGGIQEKTAAVWNFVKQQFQAAMDYIVPIVRGAITEVINWWNQMAPTFGQAIHNVYAFLVWLSPLWNALWNIIKFTVKLAFDFVVDIIKQAWGVMSGLFQFFGDLLAGNWKKLWGDVWQILSNAVMLVMNFFDVGFVLRGFTLLTKLLGHFQVFGQAAKMVFDIFRNAIKDIAEALYTFLETRTKGALSTIGDLFKAAFDIIRKVFSAFSDLFHGDVEGFFTNIKGAFETGINAAKNLLDNLFKWMDNMFGGLPSKALQWAENMINMFVQGIMNGVKKVESAVTSVVNTVKSFMGFHSPAEKGPGAEADQWMPNMMNMFVQGIDEHKPKIEQSIGAVALGLKASMMATQQTIHNNVTQQTIRPNPTSGQQIVVNINIDGRSARTDQELADIIARRLRTQMSMVSV